MPCTPILATSVGAKINGRHMPLRTVLQNGDQVEIIKSNGKQSRSRCMAGFRRSPARRAPRSAAVRPAAPASIPHGQHKPVSIRGLTPGIAYKLGECCHPVPGDRIVGMRQTGEPIEVHTIDCLASGKRAGCGLGGPCVGHQIQRRHRAACR
jgi:(p)ppGpp synthase/HD superfamily hydrolase